MTTQTKVTATTPIVKPKTEVPVVAKAEVPSPTILDVIRGAIKTHEELDTTVPLHVIVRGAIASDRGLDVSRFTLSELLNYLMLAYESLEHKQTINVLLLPLTTEYVQHTVGVEPWTYKDATLKIIYSLLNVLK